MLVPAVGAEEHHAAFDLNGIERPVGTVVPARERVQPWIGLPCLDGDDDRGGSHLHRLNQDWWIPDPPIRLATLVAHVVRFIARPPNE